MYRPNNEISSTPMMINRHSPTTVPINATLLCTSLLGGGSLPTRKHTTLLCYKQMLIEKTNAN